MNEPAPRCFYPFPWYAAAEIPHTYYYLPYVDNRDYPPVDTQILTHSAAAFAELMKDASLLLSKLQDPGTAQRLMSAAQAGNKQEVDRIVKSFGCKFLVVTTYSPSNVKFTIDPSSAGISCCELTLSLKWGK